MFSQSLRARATAVALAVFATVAHFTVTAEAQNAAMPNIVVIMGDDIGMWNIGAYHRGLMASRTPNLDKIAAEGMLFTDYYAEASCTAGRANFITGQLPIRTGMTTVGQAGSPIGLPAGKRLPQPLSLNPWAMRRASSARTILEISMSSCQPCMVSTSSSGISITLDAMEDPAHPGYPQELLDQVGPRNMVHSWATDTDDPTVQPRWGKVGKQRIEDAGTLYPKRMETVDDEIQALTFKFMDKAKADGKPYFVWLNPTRMHIVTHLSPKYEALRNSQNGWTISEAGMAQLDDIVGATMQKIKDLGDEDDTIVIFTTDNGTEVFAPMVDKRPSPRAREPVMEGGFRVPASCAGPVMCQPALLRMVSSPVSIGSELSLLPPADAAFRTSF